VEDVGATNYFAAGAAPRFSTGPIWPEVRASRVRAVARLSTSRMSTASSSNSLQRSTLIETCGAADRAKAIAPNRPARGSSLNPAKALSHDGRAGIDD